MLYVTTKNLCNLSDQKLNTLVFLMIGVLGNRSLRGGGEKGLNQWNKGKNIKIC